ncbi:MAG: hypothetical protein D6813_02020, partial [Calditrichaeota bacterium]
MAAAVTSGLIPPPSEMKGAFSEVSDSSLAKQLYLASYSFVYYLIEKRGGWSRLRKVIRQLTNGNALE